MIGYLEGKIVDLTPSLTYIDVGGVGYEVHISLYTYEALKDKDYIKLYTHLQIREDAWTMYGFYEMAEKEIFQKLISVSGVGTATARIMLSALQVKDVHHILMSGDSKALEKVKGIGAKTAQRIILELKGKIQIPIDDEQYNLSSTPHNTSNDDALKALVGLGIAKNMAEAAIAKVPFAHELSVEELIKQALKQL